MTPKNHQSGPTVWKSTTPPVNPEETLATLQQALQHHQAGRLDKAASLYQRVLDRNPRHPDALQLLGLLTHKRGDSAKAITYIKRAIDTDDCQSTFHFNLSIIYESVGQLTEALASCDQAIALDQLNPDYHHRAAVLHDLQGHTDEAIEGFNQTLSLNSQHLDARANLGYMRLKAAHYDAAIDCFETVLRADPGNANVLNNLGIALMHSHRYLDAIQAFQDALVSRPDYPDALYNLALVLQNTGDLENATAIYKQLIEADPGFLDAHLSLAEIAEKTNDDEQLSALIGILSDLAPEQPMVQRLKAMALRRGGDIDAALKTLRDTPIPADNPKLASGIHFELGRLYDLQKQSDQALHHFTRANDLLRSSSEARKFDGPRYREYAEQVLNAPPPKHFSSLNGRKPVFLVGFPRSGTTLLDNILDGHPGVTVLEEKPILDTVIAEMVSQHGAYPDCLDSLATDDLNQLRSCYWAVLGQFAEIADSQLVVDKLPLNIVHLSFISRLFPETKVIVAQRHPYDVCLSCFMQNFVLNDAMANFLTLDDAAALFATVMGGWFGLRDALPLSMHEVKYEDVVSDFEKTVTQLLGFLECPWDDAVYRFNIHAQERGNLSTASYHQVTEPLYRQAVNRWERYVTALEPYASILDPITGNLRYQTMADTKPDSQ